MSNPVAAVEKAPAKVVSFARNNVVAFVLLLLLLFWVFIRYGAKIRSTLAGLPVVGPFLGRIFVAALLIGGTALLGHAGHGAIVAAGAVMCYPFDLKTNGTTQASLTPGSSEVNSEWIIDGSKSQVAGDKWPKAARLVGRLRFVFDQAAMGGSAVNADELPRTIAALSINSPCFGQMLDRTTGSGPILKHVIDYVGAGYYNAQPARAQIAATDGDTTCDLYFSYPFAPQWMWRPEDCAPWIGLLHDTKVTFYLNTASTIAAASTGAVIKATCNLQMWLDYFVAPKFELPNVSEFKLYTQPAAGGASIKLQGIGTSSGLKNCAPFDLIAGLFELTDQAGLGGPDGADNITSVECPQLGLDSTVNVDAFFYAFRQVLAGRLGPVNSNHATNAGHAGAGGYEMISATPNGTLNTATAKFLPLIAPALGQKVTRLPKFAGNLEIKQLYTSAPSSGEHRLVVHSIKQPDNVLRADMARRAGRTLQQISGPATQDGPKLIAEHRAGVRQATNALSRIPAEVG